MTECQCGHDADDHRDKLGRCDGECVDTDHYGIYKCLCPYVTEEKL
ncbi:hypothetical protein [Mycolicibacterium sp.]|nr:hypothetical protein [Mycolicibacterium sp.]